MPDIQGMTQRQKEQMLEHFLYYLEPAGRARLMGELPKAYNAYVGKPLLIVTNTATGETV